MPERPLKVEKLMNQTANPAGSPAHSAISQYSRGLAPNSASAMSASVASISCSSLSYSASSRTSDRTSPASSGRARRIIRDINRSHRDLGLDVRVRVVAFEHEVFVAECEDILHIRIELHHRQRPRRARQLQPGLLEVVGIEVSVAQCVNEVAGLEARYLRDHHCQQRVGRDVEGYAEKTVRRTLIELARQFAACDVELKQAMTRRQRHLVDIGRIPRAHDQAPRIRIAPDHVDDVGDLVDAAPVRRRPGSPLRSVDGAEIAIGVGPFVPDRNAMVLEIFDVGIAGEKPQQLVHDRFQRQLLGGQHRESGGQIEAHLMAEYRQRAGAGAVALLRAVRENPFEQIVVLVHAFGSASWRMIRKSGYRFSEKIMQNNNLERDDVILKASRSRALRM